MSNTKQEIKLDSSWKEKSESISNLGYERKGYLQGASDFQKKAIERFEELKNVYRPRYEEHLEAVKFCNQAIETITNLKAK